MEPAAGAPRQGATGTEISGRQHTSGGSNIFDQPTEFLPGPRGTQALDRVPHTVPPGSGRAARVGQRAPGTYPEDATQILNNQGEVDIHNTPTEFLHGLQGTQALDTVPHTVPPPSVRTVPRRARAAQSTSPDDATQILNDSGSGHPFPPVSRRPAGGQPSDSAANRATGEASDASRSVGEATERLSAIHFPLLGNENRGESGTAKRASSVDISYDPENEVIVIRGGSGETDRINFNALFNQASNAGWTIQSRVRDPYYLSRGSWGQDYDDEWAIKRVGFTNDENSAWNLLDSKAKLVVVAVIDSGLAWNHEDLSLENLWINENEIPENGKDDDRNGYIDDVVGWNFVQKNNLPWDFGGHGTLLAGVIAGSQNNGIGIAGINPHAKIMVLKVVDDRGRTNAGLVAKAILYAAYNGARVINLSVGGKDLTLAGKLAIDYAHHKGAVIVVAAGNNGINVKDFGPAALNKVITVAATDPNDKRLGYSNWGAGIDIAAPGVDVLSLRAMGSDLVRGVPGMKYKPGENYVGKDKKYYRASGTSVAAPIVAGTASLMLSKYPHLTNKQVKHMLLH